MRPPASDQPIPPVSPDTEAQHQLQRLLQIMVRLRDPNTGCPWDIQQTFQSIAPYTIEEAYEVADAIATHDMQALPDELGDLLLQVVYHARIAQEASLFNFADVARSICDKMIRRHPHVFGDPSQVSGGISGGAKAWEDLKAAERAQKKTDEGSQSVLSGIAASLPALSRAAKLTARAARVGFDWPDVESVFDKLDEETRELRAELPLADKDRLEDELGDMLFVMANLARKLHLDPEVCLRRANAKFTRRFQAVEQRVATRGAHMPDTSLEELEQDWQAVKTAERSG